MAGARLCAHRTDSATEPVNGRRSTHAHRVAREAFRVRDADGTLERLTPKHVPQRIHFDLKAQKRAPQRDDSSAWRTCLTIAATLPCHRANPKWSIGRRTRYTTHTCAHPPLRQVKVSWLIYKHDRAIWFRGSRQRFCITSELLCNALESMC